MRQPVEHDIARIREAKDIHPCIKQVDTVAGEFPCQTNYLYSINFRM
jgi:carbamoyl-phosphate synthase large subunit